MDGGAEWLGAAMSDHEFRVVSETERFRGRVVTLVSDEIELPGGETSVRDYLRHLGAVAVVALDDQDRIVLLKQYRHPVGQALWELPAGLLDVAAEAAVDTAARELAEETDLRAARWDLLLDLLTTPGCSDEAIRVFLARGLSEVDLAQRHARTGEEAVMELERVGLDTAVGWVFDGTIQNATCVAGVLAVAHARARDFEGLRPVGSPWAQRPGH
jgi:ADP-ribose pyrophosphatase